MYTIYIKKPKILSWLFIWYSCGIIFSICEIKTALWQIKWDHEDAVEGEMWEFGMLSSQLDFFGIIIHFAV